MTYHSKFTLQAITLLPLVLLIGCSSTKNINADDNAALNNNQTGVLTLVANGEDFVRQGFVSKDGWRIDFDSVYVTFHTAKAYVTEPAFQPEQTTSLKPKLTISLLEKPKTIDLAKGDENAAPILVSQVKAPAYKYNAISWSLTAAEEGENKGKTIILKGKAQKNGKTINFNLGFDQKLAYECGEFVGEQRKGFVPAGGEGELEATFHFDHLFGSADLPAQDTLNQEALGFEPLAKLAKNNQITADTKFLQANLSPSDYAKLENAIASLGHVGEGHCRLVKQ
ncbi:MAG: DUF4382 domain-containing protein [Cyanobacteria bacterium J083]|nr:MAG: DUF4382 domain-containing protein [Cyanobacteria bacterium J083]